MASKHRRTTLFVTVEGLSGAGKSTLCRALEGRLQEAGVDVLRTQEPDTTPAGDSTRFLCRLLDNHGAELEPLSALLLRTAARIEHIEKVIRPALNGGGERVILCDSFADSTIATDTALNPSQMVNGYLPLALSLHDRATQGITPDITFFLAGPAETLFARRKALKTITAAEAGTATDAAAANASETAGLKTAEKTADLLQHFADREPTRFYTLDATAPAADVLKAACEYLVYPLADRGIKATWKTDEKDADPKDDTPATEPRKITPTRRRKAARRA